MQNPWDELRSAIAQAKELNRACDNSANSMALLLRGRLQHVDSWHLTALKRELRNFNMHTGKWK